MNVGQLLLDAADQRPDAPALALGGRVIASYREHADRSLALAGKFLGELKLSPGDRVAICMKNDPAYSELMFGAWLAGCTIVPINARLHPQEIDWILEDADASLCFAAPDIAEGLTFPGPAIVAGSSEHLNLYDVKPLEEAVTPPDGLAWLFYTSGTTGRPKGAMLSHPNLLAMNRAYFASVDDIAADDCIIHAAPMSHGSGLYLLPHVAKGACQVIPQSGGFDPAEIVGLLEHWPGTTMFLAPTMVKRLVDEFAVLGTEAKNLKSVIYGGGPMYVDDCLRALDVLGPKLIQIYGQGEAPMTITALNREAHVDRDNPKYIERIASVGTAQFGVDVKVVGENGDALPVGEIGEIVVQGDVVMGGYWRNEVASADSLRDGWLYTGDMGVLDADGYLTLKDRSKDVIISGGSNIYPREVEEVLLRHAGVQECSIIGRPSAEWGEEVVAFIVAVDDAPPSDGELDALCLEHIARFKRPKEYCFVDALPKNNYGKVLKTALREMV